MTRFHLEPNPAMRRRHSALSPIMKYLFHQHFQEPQYRGTYYETLLTDLENATKIVRMLLSDQYTTPISAYIGLRENKAPWKTHSAFNMASDALRAGDEMFYRACYLYEKKGIDFDQIMPIHPASCVGKKSFNFWVRMMSYTELNSVDCKSAYYRWVRRSYIGKKFEETRKKYDYAISSYRVDLRDTDHVCVVSKRWIPGGQCKNQGKTRQ